MCDLLPDNIALAECLEALPTHRSPSKAPESWEVSALPTLVSVFSTYVATVAAAHAEHTKDMLAYLRLLVREAQKYRGSGWVTYDQVFRRNQTGPEARWDQLDPSLHIAYILAQADTPAVPCSICNEIDHVVEDCALASLAPPTKSAMARTATPTRDWVRGAYSRSVKRPLPPRSQAGSTQKHLCLSWNKGKCLFPGSCNYLHVCATCHEQHPARDSSQTPPDSGFRQNRPAPKPANPDGEPR